MCIGAKGLTPSAAKAQKSSSGERCHASFRGRLLWLRDYIEGKWKEIRGKVRERWGKLTDDDLDVVAGKRDQLVGIIQQRYGLAKDESERQLSEFEQSHLATEGRSAR